jgi:hypothetical protein
VSSKVGAYTRDGTWYTLVRGPESLPVPYPVTKDERAVVRSVLGASLFECEKHAHRALVEYHTPPNPRHRYVPWKKGAWLYVLPPTDVERRIAAMRLKERPR